MKNIYYAKEPDAGVRDDLAKMSGEVTVVDCLDAYGDYYRKIGYNSISTADYFANTSMHFSQTIGNPIPKEYSLRVLVEGTANV